MANRKHNKRRNYARYFKITATGIHLNRNGKPLPAFSGGIKAVKRF